MGLLQALRGSGERGFVIAVNHSRKAAIVVLTPFKPVKGVKVLGGDAELKSYQNDELTLAMPGKPATILTSSGKACFQGHHA